MTSTKSLPLTKEEVSLLITLVEGQSAITCKSTNATSNQMKEEAWKKITDQFNAAIASGPRKPEQLRLKWENLKKAARKRSVRIRLNNLKTGGGKPEYIPPDDSLDKVAAILGATCTGYTISFGGDADPEPSTTIEYINEAQVTTEPLQDVNVESAICAQASTSAICAQASTSAIGAQASTNEHLVIPVVPKKFYFSSASGSGAKRKRKMNEEDIKARTSRNLAIAEYYQLKKRKIALEIEKLELENKKLRSDLNI